MTTPTIAPQNAASSASSSCSPNFDLEPRANSRKRSGLVGVGGASAQGQWDRVIAKREHARKHFFVGLHLGQTRRWRKWEKVMDKTWQCEVCKEHGVECRMPETLESQPPDAILCQEHARGSGYCSFCGDFSADQWDFDFRGNGLCDGCRRELRDCCPPELFPGPLDLALRPFLGGGGAEHGDGNATPRSGANSGNEKLCNSPGSGASPKPTTL